MTSRQAIKHVSLLKGVNETSPTSSIEERSDDARCGSPGKARLKKRGNSPPALTLTKLKKQKDESRASILEKELICGLNAKTN